MSPPAAVSSLIITVKRRLQDVYAIGECANWGDTTYGLIAPGIEMADILSFNLTQAKDHKIREFKAPDLSTKLKLMGVDVASFGDYFADRDGPKSLPTKHGKKHHNISRRRSAAMITGEVESIPVKALQYKDPFSGVYKKYIFHHRWQVSPRRDDDWRHSRLHQIRQSGQNRETSRNTSFTTHPRCAKRRAKMMLPDLDDDAQICSCHNVTKGMVAGLHQSRRL